MFETILINPLFNILLGLYRITGSLGLGIIAFTIIAKTLLLPVTIPNIKMSKKQRDIQPELKKIQDKYKHDQTKLAQEQLKLFKKHKINPGMGCITAVITIVLMLAVYRSVNLFTQVQNVTELNNRIYIQDMTFAENEVINSKFLYLDLTKPDPYLIITILAVVAQFLVTKMIMPYSKVADKATKQTPGKTDDMIQAMQKQNLYLMPLLFFVFGLTLPSGVILYIVTSTVVQMAQTLYFTGWGGLKPWVQKIGLIKK